jgi:hypothetical protein
VQALLPKAGIQNNTFHCNISTQSKLARSQHLPFITQNTAGALLSACPDLRSPATQTVMGWRRSASKMLIGALARRLQRAAPCSACTVPRLLMRPGAGVAASWFFKMLELNKEAASPAPGRTKRHAGDRPSCCLKLCVMTCLQRLLDPVQQAP